LGLAPANQNTGLSHPASHSPAAARLNQSGLQSLQFQPGKPSPAANRGRGRGAGRGASTDDANAGPPPARASTLPVKSSVTDEDNSQRVSHGASEKQRRDRINAMIDELRSLVPGQPGQSEGRRSKYIVLQDTINLITSVKARCEEQERELAALRAGGGGGGGGGAPSHLREMLAIGQGGQGSDPAGEAAVRNPANGSDSVLSSGEVLNVAVEMGAEICYVKIKAPDRQGLLQDILNALHALPMKVQRAVVTTDTENGVVFVTDIFELAINTAIPFDQRISAEETKARLHSTLHESFLAYENPELYARKRNKPELKSEDSGTTA